MRRTIWKSLAVGVLLLLAALASLAMQIDDWDRALTTNYAATGLDASDPMLRTLEL